MENRLERNRVREKKKKGVFLFSFILLQLSLSGPASNEPFHKIQRMMPPQGSLYQ